MSLVFDNTFIRRHSSQISIVFFLNFHASKSPIRWNNIIRVLNERHMSPSDHQPLLKGEESRAHKN